MVWFASGSRFMLKHSQLYILFAPLLYIYRYTMTSPSWKSINYKLTLQLQMGNLLCNWYWKNWYIKIKSCDIPVAFHSIKNDKFWICMHAGAEEVQSCWCRITEYAGHFSVYFLDNTLWEEIIYHQRACAVYYLPPMNY